VTFAVPRGLGRLADCSHERAFDAGPSLSLFEADADGQQAFKPLDPAGAPFSLLCRVLTVEHSCHACCRGLPIS